MPTRNLARNTTDELRSEYDLSSLKGRVRGKYYSRATADATLVLLEPDVAKAVPYRSSVNEALRTYLRTSRADRDKAA